MAKTENEVLMTSSVRSEVDRNNNNDNNNNDANSVRNDTCVKNCTNTSSSGGKYQLRPRSLQTRRRSDSEWCFHEPLRQKKPQHLSRYRRKTANARERYRMRQINTAFENLRGVLPSWVCSRRTASDMTKIATLKLASAYIRSLQDILDGNTNQDETYSWVFSAILKEESASTEYKIKPDTSASNNKCQFPTTHISPDSDLMSLLCASNSDSPVDQEDDDLGSSSFSFLSTSGNDSDPITLLLLESESVKYWNDEQQSPLVV